MPASEASVFYPGDFLMFGFPGKDAGGLFAHFRRVGVPRGIIYFGRNAGTPDEIREVNRQVQATWSRPEQSIPPVLIAVDQEGGTVARLMEGFSVFPSNMAFGAIYAADAARGTDLCHKAALATARELRGAGFNMNLAPCMDVNTNPQNPVIGTRSYSDRPDVVSDLGLAAIRGMAEGGVLACAKHFPGHGDTSIDSHTGLPVEEWDEKYVPVHVEPFRRAIEAGVPAIMSSHIGFSDQDRYQPSAIIPASLSRKMLTGVLREQMGFKGLILTDCLEMGAITSTFGTANAASMAVTAGANMVLISHTPEVQRKTYGELRVPSEIGAQFTRRDVYRILMKLAGWRESPATPELPPHDTLVRDTARASITVLQKKFDPAQQGGPPLLLVPFRQGGTMALEPGESPLATSIRRRIPGAQVELYGEELSESEIKRLSSKARPAPWVLFAASNMHLHPGQATLATAVLEANPAFVLLDIATPYSVLALPSAPYVVCSYGHAPCQIAAAMDVVTGDRSPEGRLPVDVPGVFRFGYGLKG